MSVVDPAVGALVAETTILLVEDDDGDALLVQACLTEAGVADRRVTWVRTLADAVRATEQDAPGCILLDLGLPDAVGWGAVHSMVAAAPDVAVIVLTGRRERDGIDALGAGAQDYLVKDDITGELLQRSMRYAIERKRAQHQLREVRLSAAEQARLERGLLPRALLRTDAVTCATYYRPGRDDAVLGGDFFDVVETPDGRIRAVIGDVMGHGPDEAALGVHLRVAWRTMLLAGVPDDDVFPTLSLLLGSEDLAPRFVTVCDVVLDRGEMTVRVAGHPAPVVCRDGQATYLDLRIGPPLGVVAGAGAALWPQNRVAVTPGSAVLLYTDGLLDAYAAAGAAEIGIPDLVAAVAGCTRSGGPAESWIEALVAAAPHPSIDDTAVVVLTTNSDG